MNRPRVNARRRFNVDEIYAYRLGENPNVAPPRVPGIRVDVEVDFELGDHRRALIELDGAYLAVREQILATAPNTEARPDLTEEQP